MTVLSAQTIRRLGLIHPCLDPYRDASGNSGGLGPCGYDLALKEGTMVEPGGFSLASTVERFVLPSNVVGIIHDKSSLARRGIAVQNTVAEPGWRGYLTLEFTNHGLKPLWLPSQSAVAQVVFHFLDEDTDRPYAGKYQDQASGPQEAK